MTIWPILALPGLHNIILTLKLYDDSKINTIYRNKYSLFFLLAMNIKIDIFGRLIEMLRLINIKRNTSGYLCGY